jgi:hypothetical protein
MDSLTEMISQAEADVREREALAATADNRVTAAQADAAAAHESLNEARIVLAWLLRHSEDRPVAASSPSQDGQPQAQPEMRFGKPVPEKPKLDWCLEALEGLGGTARNKAISTRVVRDGGPEMDPDHVRGLLKYASRKKPPPVTTESGSGLWVLQRSLNGVGGES